MIVVDASIWVSRLVPQDVHYEASRRWLVDQLARGTVLVAPVLLLAEVAGAVSRRTGQPGLARRAVDHIIQVPTLRIVQLDHLLGLESANLAAELCLRGADAAYVAVAQRLDVPLATWDAEQRDRGGQAVTIFTPQL